MANNGLVIKNVVTNNLIINKLVINVVRMCSKVVEVCKKTVFKQYNSTKRCVKLLEISHEDGQNIAACAEGLRDAAGTARSGDIMSTGAIADIRQKGRR